MHRSSYPPTRTAAGVRRPQSACADLLAPTAVLADGIIKALEQAREFARRGARPRTARAMNALDDRMLQAIGADRARIVRVVTARERIDSAWFPGDPL